MAAQFIKCLADVFGRNLHQVMLANGVSRKNLADTCEVSTSAIGLWCKGDQLPTVSTLWIIAKELDVTIDELLRD